MAFEVVREESGGTCVLRISGEVDHANSIEARARIGELVLAEDKVILDVRELSFMDSSGLAMLLGLIGNRRDAVALVLGGPFGQRVRAYGLDGLVMIAESPEAAAAALVESMSKD